MTSISGHFTNANDSLLYPTSSQIFFVFSYFYYVLPTNIPTFALVLFYNYSFLAVLHISISMSIVFLNPFLRRIHYLAHLPNLFAPLTTMKHILVACLTSTFSYIFNVYSHDYTNTKLKLTCLHL